MYFHVYDPTIYFRKERGVSGKQDGITANIDWNYVMPRIYHWPAHRNNTEDGYHQSSLLEMGAQSTYFAYWGDWWGGHEAKAKALLRVPYVGGLSTDDPDNIEVTLTISRFTDMSDYTERVYASETTIFEYDTDLSSGVLLETEVLDIPSTVGDDQLIPDQGETPAELMGIYLVIDCNSGNPAAVVRLNPIVVMLYPNDPTR